MKKTLVLVAILAVAAGTLSYSVAHWFACRNQPPTAANLNDPVWLKRELSLTADQSLQVDAMERDFRTQINRFCADHCAARFALGAELAKPAPDPKTARMQVEKM